MKKSVTKHIFGFDTLRFVAITLIVVYHVFPGALPGGFVAVESFFVLSGFLICQKLMRSKKKEGKNFGTAKSFINYFWNRLARFLPTLLFSIILILTLAYFAEPDLLTASRQNSLSAVTFTTNIVALRTGATYENSLIPNLFNPTWYLALEMQICIIFYAVFAVFYRITNDKKWRIRRQYRVFARICLLIGVLSFVLMAVYGGYFGLHDRAYFGTDSHIGAFMLGAAMASYLAIQPRIKLAKKKWAWWLLLLSATAGVLAMTLLVVFNSKETFYFALPGTALLTMAIILAILKLQGKAVPKIIKPFEFLGSISFPIYLLHYGLYILFPSLLSFVPLEITPYLAILASILISIILIKIIVPFSKKHKKIFAILLLLSFILPVLALIKAPEKSSIELQLQEASQEVAEKLEIDTTNITLDYNGAAAMASVLKTDVMKWFDGAKNFAKPYPTRAVYGAGYVPGGRAWYNTPDYSRVSALSRARVLVLGDSVVVGATNAIYNMVPGAFVDAKQSRNMTDAINLLAGYRAANGGTLPRVIVVALVTNYYRFTTGTLQMIMDAAGPGHQFVFITGYCGDQDRSAQNATLRAFASMHGNVRVADWVSVVVPNVGAYTYADHTHLTPAGRTAYGRLVANATAGL